MLNYNMVAKANNLIIGKLDEPLAGRIEIAKVILEAAVEIINSRSSERRDELTDEITAFGEDNYGMVLPDKVLDSYVEELVNDIKRAHWDSRLLIKLTYFNLGTSVYTASLEMDLEGTVEKLGWDKVTTKEDGEDIRDIVDDNPSMDTINAINRLDDVRRKQQSTVLPYRTSGFVQRVQRRDR